MHTLEFAVSTLYHLKSGREKREEGKDGSSNDSIVGLHRDGIRFDGLKDAFAPNENPKAK